MYVYTMDMVHGTWNEHYVTNTRLYKQKQKIII